MLSIRRILLVLPLLAAASTAALAQTEPPGMMPTTVVTADRFPTDPDKITSSYTVIPQEEMERRQLRTVGDVLRTVPGVSVQQNGGPGSLTSVFVRGTNSDHVLVLIDGINVSDPSSASGAVDFGNFLTENLDRIEVVRGPMSTLYGSQAIGGVINMVTKAGKGPMNGGAFTELGTRLQTNSGGYVRGSEGRFNYNFTLAGTYAPGETIVPGRYTPPGGTVIGPKWSKKMNGPTVRRFTLGRTRRTEKPGPSSCARPSMRSSIGSAISLSLHRHQNARVIARGDNLSNAGLHRRGPR